MSRLVEIDGCIRAAGLAARGALALEPGERDGLWEGLATIVLVGMVGVSNWPAFAASPEYRDGRPDPLDRWSARVIGALAADLGAVAIFPFGGPPYAPFQRWALRAEPLSASPLGLLIHPKYGLWHSFRGALGFAEAFEIPAPQAVASPCESCAERPCLQACPVGAFTSGGYDVAACAAHLRRPEGAPCMTGGCLARRACPVGREHAQTPGAAAFHMAAFLASRPA